MPYTKTTVGYNRAEREILQTAWANIHIAVPDLGTLPENDDNVKMARALRGLAQGNTGSYETLCRAEGILTTLWENCVEQSQTDYWERTLKPERRTPVGIAKTTGRLEVPLVADGMEVCRVLAETRSAQVVNAKFALDLIQYGLSLIPEGESDTIASMIDD